MLLWKSNIMLNRYILKFYSFSKLQKLPCQQLTPAPPRSYSPGHPFLELRSWDPQCALEFARIPQTLYQNQDNPSFPSFQKCKILEDHQSNWSISNPMPNSHSFILASRNKESDYFSNGYISKNRDRLQTVQKTRENIPGLFYFQPCW